MSATTSAPLGVVTPFCSCSAVPLFIGFVTTGVPLGVTFAFLVSAPMVNEVALGREAVRDLVGKVWPYVVAGIAVGAGIHGYVPEGFMASIMGREACWSVPLAVLFGIPLYSNAAGILPL